MLRSGFDNRVRAEIPSHKAAQQLLGRLLAAVGPMALEIMISYLHCRPATLLADVALLEMIATLLPNLSRRIIQTLADIIDDLMSGTQSICES
jgi:hypothetical protein